MSILYLLIVQQSPTGPESKTVGLIGRGGADMHTRLAAGAPHVITQQGEMVSVSL